jgi:hypothetical protein
MKSLMKLVLLLWGVLFVPFVYSNCDVIDVIEMYDEEDLSKREIRNECSNSVTDAPNCSVRKVIRLYDDGYDEEEISAKCSGSNRNQEGQGYGGSQQPQQAQVSNICQTPMMWCALGQSGPIGTPCWCNSGLGPQNGRIIAR